MICASSGSWVNLIQHSVWASVCIQLCMHAVSVCIASLHTCIECDALTIQQAVRIALLSRGAVGHGWTFQLELLGLPPYFLAVWIALMIDRVAEDLPWTLHSLFVIGKNTGNGEQQKRLLPQEHHRPDVGPGHSALRCMSPIQLRSHIRMTTRNVSLTVCCSSHVCPYMFSQSQFF